MLQSVSMRRLLRPGADHCGSISAGAQIWILASLSSSFRSSPATVTIFTRRCERKESRPRTDLLFSIGDPHHGAAVVSTENLTGSHAWMPVDVDYTTGPQTHFLIVQVRRAQSHLFENKLSGTAWIGDVSLTPSSAPPPSK